MAVIYLIRHGQASWGQQDYDNLSERGVEQSKILGAALRHRLGKPDRVISGTMRRHRQTAEHTLRAMGAEPLWIEDSRWNEYDHEQLLRQAQSAQTGSLPSGLGSQLINGQEIKFSFQQFFDSALRRWISGEHDMDYAETWPDFQSRVAIALHQSIEENPGVTLVFTSGGAISAAVRQIWQLPSESWLNVNRVIANATITKLVIGKQGLHLSTFNEHHHFEGSSRSLLTYR
jgi:broad specificity phosphatase PhoE